MRACQNGAERITHAAVEAARHVSRLVERHQRVDIFGSHRATERASREVLNDLVRAGRFLSWRVGLGLADENLRAAGRPAHTGHRERSADLQRMRGLDALLTTFERNGANAFVALGEAAMHEGNPELVLTRGSVELDPPQPVVDSLNRGIERLIDRLVFL